MSETPDTIEDAAAKTVTIIDYVNWRGERGRRRIIPKRILFGATEWHPEPQWLLEALDLDKGETRLFAIRDIQAWEPDHGPG